MYNRILVPLEHSEYDHAIVEHVRKLAAMCHAAVGIEPRFVCVGVQRQVLERADIRLLCSHGNEARKIEIGVIGARRWFEETGMCGGLRSEARDEFRPDLVAVAADRRSERDSDIGALRA